MNEEEEEESLMLSIGKDGKAELHKPEDYINIKEKDVEKLIKENRELIKLLDDMMKWINILDSNKNREMSDNDYRELVNRYNLVKGGKR